GQVDLAAADQPLLRSLAVAVLEENPQETQRVEMHLLPCAKSASRQTVDGTLELAERPALIEVLAGGDDRADVVRLVAHEVAAGLRRPRAVPRIVRTVDTRDDGGKRRIGVESERPHQPGCRDLREHFTVAAVAAVVLHAYRFTVRRPAGELRCLAPQLGAG